MELGVNRTRFTQQRQLPLEPQIAKPTAGSTAIPEANPKFQPLRIGCAYY